MARESGFLPGATVVLIGHGAAWALEEREGHTLTTGPGAGHAYSPLTRLGVRSPGITTSSSQDQRGKSHRGRRQTSKTAQLVNVCDPAPGQGSKGQSERMVGSRPPYLFQTCMWAGYRTLVAIRGNPLLPPKDRYGTPAPRESLPSPVQPPGSCAAAFVQPPPFPTGLGGRALHWEPFPEQGLPFSLARN